jgi:hypothetical protein
MQGVGARLIKQGGGYVRQTRRPENQPVGRMADPPIHGGGTASAFRPTSLQEVLELLRLLAFRQLVEDRRPFVLQAPEACSHGVRFGCRRHAGDKPCQGKGQERDGQEFGRNEWDHVGEREWETRGILAMGRRGAREFRGYFPERPGAGLEPSGKKPQGRRSFPGRWRNFVRQRGSEAEPPGSKPERWSSEPGGPGSAMEHWSYFVQWPGKFLDGRRLERGDSRSQ